MTTTISITNNWQIHIPQSARKIVGLDKPGTVTIHAEPGKLTVFPHKSKILSLGGSLNHIYLKNPVNIDKIREEIDYS